MPWCHFLYVCDFGKFGKFYTNISSNSFFLYQSLLSSDFNGTNRRIHMSHRSLLCSFTFNFFSFLFSLDNFYWSAFSFNDSSSTISILLLSPPGDFFLSDFFLQLSTSHLVLFISSISYLRSPLSVNFNNIHPSFTEYGYSSFFKGVVKTVLSNF